MLSATEQVSFRQLQHPSISAVPLPVGVLAHNPPFDICEALRGLCGRGHWNRAVCLLDSKIETDGSGNLLKAYASLLTECIETKSLAEARQIHAHMRLNGFEHSVALNNLLLHVYIRCVSIKDAQDVFDCMLRKDADSWTSMIGFYVRLNRTRDALRLFSIMVSEGVKPNGVTCVDVLKATCALSCLMLVHGYIILQGLQHNPYIRNTLLDMYCKWGSIEDAVYVFLELPVQSVISWNMIISGHIHNGFSEKALELFQEMKTRGVKPDEVTFLCTIKACTKKLAYLHHLHTEINCSMVESNSFIASALIVKYSAFGSMSYTPWILEKVKSQDAALWNSLILGYAENDNTMEAINLFSIMGQNNIAPDKVTFLILLKACARIQDLATGKRIFSYIIQFGMEAWPFVGSAVVDMYAKCWNLEDAQYVFNRLPEQDLVSWNAIIAAYSMHEFCLESLDLFQTMLRKGIKPDKITFLTIIKACANLGALEQGTFVHACIYENGFDSDVFVGSTLIDMYGKCGKVCYAREVFSAMCQRDAVSWSALIAGYALLGQADEAIEIFLEMQNEGILIDDVTYVGILTACTHVGLVQKGFEYFDMMKKIHGIMPTAEVCACMVDLLGRAGQIVEAITFISVVEVEPTASVWMALLNACKLSGDVVLACLVSQKEFPLEIHVDSALLCFNQNKALTATDCKCNQTYIQENGQLKTSASGEECKSVVWHYCGAGISRSATLCAAYLMRGKHWTVEEALKFLQDQRSKVNPNPGFLSALHNYHCTVKSNGCNSKLTSVAIVRTAKDSHLDVMKDGKLIGDIPLGKGELSFGRGKDCNVILEHASISRHHAVVMLVATDGEAEKDHVLERHSLLARKYFSHCTCFQLVDSSTASTHATYVNEGTHRSGYKQGSSKGR